MKVLLTPHRGKFVDRKMKGGGYLSPDEVVREALRVYELVEQEDNDLQLEAALAAPLQFAVEASSVAISLNRSILPNCDLPGSPELDAFLACL